MFSVLWERDGAKRKEVEYVGLVQTLQEVSSRSQNHNENEGGGYWAGDLFVSPRQCVGL